MRKGLKSSTKLRQITELFHIWQRDDINPLQQYDQNCGKLCHNRPNFTRLPLCYVRLNWNETSLRGPKRCQSYQSLVLHLPQYVPKGHYSTSMLIDNINLVSQLHLFPLKFSNPESFGRMKKIESQQNLKSATHREASKICSKNINANMVSPRIFITTMLFHCVCKNNLFLVKRMETASSSTSFEIPAVFKLQASRKKVREFQKLLMIMLVPSFKLRTSHLYKHFKFSSYT